MIYSVVFCFVSNGAVVGSRLSRVKFPNNSVWSTMKIAAVAYWKASSIWISANKSTPDCGWSTKNKNSSTCLMWKRHDERIIWPPNRKQTWSTGWTLYARCAICRIWPNNRQPARIHVNVSQSKFFNKLWFDLLFARYNNLSLSFSLRRLQCGRGCNYQSATRDDNVTESSRVGLGRSQRFDGHETIARFDPIGTAESSPSTREQCIVPEFRSATASARLYDARDHGMRDEFSNAIACASPHIESKGGILQFPSDCRGQSYAYIRTISFVANGRWQWRHRYNRHQCDA